MSWYSRQKNPMNALINWADLRTDQGFDVSGDVKKAVDAVEAIRRKLEKMTPRELDRKEPAALPAIRGLRPAGPRRLWEKIPAAEFRRKLRGAWLGRCAGNILGANVEFYEIDTMRRLAAEMKMNWPPTDYWPETDTPYQLRYGMDPKSRFTRSGLSYVPCDDDLAYTLLGLLVLEDYGPDFTLEQLGKAWVKYLPMACTAEKVALANLKKKIPAEKAGLIDNPFMEWIGGDIRSDPWGYAAPGWPEKAAELAYRDGFLTHRYSGLYGAMYVAAVISAAFATGDVEEALRIGLSEIPRDCRTAKAVQWALHKQGVRNWKQARAAVGRRFAGMSEVHTDNNLALALFGLRIGKKDFTKAIGETVAMGMDNDCNAATVGSIFGAAYGIEAIDDRWHKPFRNRQRTYLKGREWFSIPDTLKRFETCAHTVFTGG